ncbi:MAG TPA: hypothetical protein VEL76_34185 [Gemmataceae bacterium]|nr:hypothetical protein [Gemmataceae bacterium]
MLEIICPSCGRKLGLPENAAGRQARCPGCNGVFSVVVPPVRPLIPPDAVQPLAPPQPPSAADPFDFNPPEVQADVLPAEPIDFADTGDDLTHLRAQVQTGSAVAWLLVAGSANMGIALLLLLDLVIESAPLGSAVVRVLIGVLLVIAPSVFICLAGVRLRVYRGLVLVRAGGVLALIETAVFLIFAVALGIALLDSTNVRVRPMVYVLLAACLACIAFNLLAGVRALVTINKPAVQELYRRR